MSNLLAFPCSSRFSLLNLVFEARRLTRQLFPTRPDFAALTVIAFLLAPSRPTLHAVPYTEPFAAFFTFLGMLLFSRGRSFLAAVAWAMGSAFRAQGIVLGFGYFGWRYLLQDLWKDGPGFTARQVRVSGTSTLLHASPQLTHALNATAPAGQRTDIRLPFHLVGDSFPRLRSLHLPAILHFAVNRAAVVFSGARNELRLGPARILVRLSHSHHGENATDTLSRTGTRASCDTGRRCSFPIFSSPLRSSHYALQHRTRSTSRIPRQRGAEPFPSLPLRVDSPCDADRRSRPARPTRSL